MSEKKHRASPYVAGVVATVLSVAEIVLNVAIEVDEPGWMTGIGLACLVLAVMFALPPFFHLRRFGEPIDGDAYFATTRVVDRGAYAVVRHPQYVGYSLLVFGFACLNPHRISFVLAVGASAFFYMQAIAEERYCAVHLGPDYDDYIKRVPRFNFLLGLCRLAAGSKGTGDCWGG